MCTGAHMAVSHIDHVTTLHLLGPGAQKCQLLGWLDVLPKGRVMEMINRSSSYPSGCVGTYWIYSVLMRSWWCDSIEVYLQKKVTSDLPLYANKWRGNNSQDRKMPHQYLLDLGFRFLALEF